MKTYEQRMQDVQQKAYKMRKKRRAAMTAAVSSLCVVAMVMSVVLFTPYSTALPDVSRYSASPYYGLIQKLNASMYTPPRYKNNFQKWSAALSSLKSEVFDEDFLYSPEGGAPMPGSPVPDEAPESSDVTADGGYVEVTDNQVAGVIEADIFKRTDDYVFYLRDQQLTVYSIEGADSVKLSVYQLPWEEKGDRLRHFYGSEMYLSPDGKTLTLVQDCFWKTPTDNGEQVCVLSLDVSDPAKITEKGRFYLDGSLVSSRMTDGKLLLISRHYLGKIDFDDETSFLPQIETAEGTQSIPAEQVFYPDTINSRDYTVVCKLDTESLEIEGSAAFLSYSNDIYVSRENIFVTRSYSENRELEGGYVENETMTAISGLSYGGEKMELLGTVCVKGAVKNQYSMDEYEGILRVVTTTRKENYKRVAYTGELTSSVELMNRTLATNASLYCISLEDFSVAASVEHFAPEGESAESVRFDGAMAYVCTAEVVQLTDPVYFFDLSDISNITYTDTGTIDGYSSSLVDFGDHLLGIGFSGSGGVKLEIYREENGKVISVCSYEAPYSVISQTYKSYFIDREQQFVGLGIGHPEGQFYTLFYFDGTQLREFVRQELGGSLAKMRAFYADGWLYMLGDTLQVAKVW